jgi:suppressor of tumorigenicity protein 13
VHKIEEHRRKYDRLRKERDEKRAAREREARRAEAQVIHMSLLKADSQSKF